MATEHPFDENDPMWAYRDGPKYPHMPDSKDVARRKAIARMVDDPVCAAVAAVRSEDPHDHVTRVVVVCLGFHEISLLTLGISTLLAIIEDDLSSVTDSFPFLCRVGF